MEQPELELSKGSLRRLSFDILRTPDHYWTVRVWHYHEGEFGMCPYIDTYDQLAHGEMVEVVSAVASQTNLRFTVSDGRCGPEGESRN